MARKEALFQLIWGIALTYAGIMMLIYIPQKCLSSIKTVRIKFVPPVCSQNE